MQTAKSRELGQQIIDLAASLNRTQSALILTVAEFDRTGGWVPTGATSCAVWLARNTDIELSTAREQVRVGRALASLPLLSKAFSSGTLSYTKVRILTRHATPQNESDLVKLGATASADAIGRELARRLHEDCTDEELAALHTEARFCSFRTEPEGTMMISLRVPPLVGAEIVAAVDALVMAKGSNGVQAGPPADASQGLSLPQQRADAVVSLILDHDTSSDSTLGLTKTHAELLLHVHVTEDGRTLGITTDGSPVPTSEVERFADRAQLRVLWWDSKGKPIDASHARRRPTRRQTRVVQTRDRHRCSSPGCTARAFLEVHHVQHREHGGPTTVNNLALLCGYHHRQHHKLAS